MDFKNAMSEMIDSKICKCDNSRLQYRFHKNKLEYFGYDKIWTQSNNAFNSHNAVNWEIVEVEDEDEDWCLKGNEMYVGGFKSSGCYDGENITKMCELIKKDLIKGHFITNEKLCDVINKRSGL